MGALGTGDIIRVGVDVLNTSVSEATNKIQAQTGDNSGKGQVDCDNVDWWQHVGFASRPASPEKGKEAAQAVVVRRGQADAAIASQDIRGLAIYGQLKPGETCVYAAGADGTAQARILLKADGSINLFTKEGNDSGGKGMGLFLNPDGSISMASHNGAAILVGSDGSIKVFNGSGGVQVTEDGSIKLASGAKVEISGASITLGGASALPLAIGPQVVTALTSINTRLIAMEAAWAALGALSGPVLGAMIQPIAAPIAGISAAGIATLSAASPLIPTKRVSGD